MSPYVLNPERLKTNVNECKNQGCHPLSNETGYIRPLHVTHLTIYLSCSGQIPTMEVKKVQVLVLRVLVTYLISSHKLPSLFRTPLVCNTSKDKGQLPSLSLPCGVRSDGQSILGRTVGFWGCRSRVRSDAALCKLGFLLLACPSPTEMESTSQGELDHVAVV